MLSALASFLRRMLIGQKLRKVRRALRGSQELASALGGGVALYNELMQPQRSRLRGSVDGLYARLGAMPPADRRLALHLYLLYFSAIGARMVARADAWLRDWGADFKSLGLNGIGDELVRHAAEEAGHDRWHRNDVASLSARIEAEFGLRLAPADALQEAAGAACLKEYYTLCESVARGADVPLCLAVLYETEIMALDLAPEFIGYCVGELGFGVLGSLSFLKGHVVSDIEHIKDNVHQMDAYLKARPQDVERIVQAGAVTARVYAGYFGQALDHALRSKDAPRPLSLPADARQPLPA